MGATAAFVEVHTTCVVISAIEESLYVPMAVYCKARPFAIELFSGVIAIDNSLGDMTVRVLLSEIEPLAAVISVIPVVSPEATPLNPKTSFTVAAAGFEEVHVTESVIFVVEASVYVPVAVYCSVLPMAIDSLPGLTAIDTSSAAVTVIPEFVLSEIVPRIAEIVTVPTACPVARPSEPAVLLIVVIPVLEEIHVTVSVKSLLIHLCMSRLQ